MEKNTVSSAFVVSANRPICGSGLPLTGWDLKTEILISVVELMVLLGASLALVQVRDDGWLARTEGSGGGGGDEDESGLVLQSPGCMGTVYDGVFPTVCPLIWGDVGDSSD
jgi:hypothetical protein